MPFLIAFSKQQFAVFNSLQYVQFLIACDVQYFCNIFDCVQYATMKGWEQGLGRIVLQ